MAQVLSELSYLQWAYQRMRSIGRVDVTILSPTELSLLDDLAPTGDASELSLRQLRDLPDSLDLRRDLAKAGEAEARLVKSVYDERRPLYETLRISSPSFAARSKVLREAWGRDSVTGLTPRTGTLDVDHVVALSEIVWMPGFEQLRPDRRLDIVNDLYNLRAIDSAANRSKGQRAYTEWRQGSTHYSNVKLAEMRQLEAQLRAYLVARIAALRRL